jgi:hypothetical protein
MKQVQVSHQGGASFLIARNERTIRITAMLDPFELSTVVDLYLSRLLPLCGIDLMRSPKLQVNRKGWGPGTHPWKDSLFHHPTLFSLDAEIFPMTDPGKPSRLTAELHTNLESWQGNSLAYNLHLVRNGALRADVPLAYLGRVPGLNPVEITGGFEILTVSRWSHLIGAAPSPSLSFAIGADQSQVIIELRTDRGVDTDLLGGVMEKLSAFFGKL